MAQETKRVIDVGEVGNASTGDILYDGGVKINSNFNGIYNAFGDQRLGAIADGENLQTIYATGYYQKVTQRDFKTPVAMGTMWDVDTSSGAASPIITAGLQGESVEFINTNGSWSVGTPLVITLSGGTFSGVQGSLVVTAPFSKVVCWCTSVNGTTANWNYSITSLFGDFKSPIDGSYSALISNDPIRIAHSTEYDSIKLLITCSNSNKSKLRHSEVSLLIDSTNKNVYSTEYGVIKVGNTSEDDEIVDISYDIDLNNYLNINISSKISGMKVAIKTIATQKIGAA